jgi:spore coat polysaccharide biosynthesis protein SpsF (cytidylyltransferase family)
MKIGVLINARLDSKRLPRKHLRIINNLPAISYLVERLKEFKPIIATGNRKANADLEACCHVEYGDDQNIPFRHLQIANRLGLDGIVSVDGDDLFTSTIAVKASIEALQQGKKLIRTQGLPYGFNVLWGYSARFLNKVLLSKEYEQVLDTGWGKIFDGKKTSLITYTIPYDTSSIHATLDTQEDLDWFTKVITNCPKEILFNDGRLIEWITKNA